MGSRFSINYVSPSTSPRSANRPPSPVLESPSDVTFYHRSKPFWDYYDAWLNGKEGTYCLFLFANDPIRERLHLTRDKEEIYSIFYYLHSVISHQLQQAHQDKSSRHPIVYWKQHSTGQVWPEYNKATSNYRLFDSAGYFYQTCSDLLRYIPKTLYNEERQEASKEVIYYSKLSRCCYTISDQYANCAIIIEKLSQPKYSSLSKRISVLSKEDLLQEEGVLLQMI